MRYRKPIVQRGLTREEAEETRSRYIKLNPGAKVTIDSEPENPSLKILIALLPVLPFRYIREPGFVGYKGWRC